MIFSSCCEKAPASRASFFVVGHNAPQLDRPSMRASSRIAIDMLSYDHTVGVK